MFWFGLLSKKNTEFAYGAFPQQLNLSIHGVNTAHSQGIAT